MDFRNNPIIPGAARALFVQWYASAIEEGDIEGEAAGGGEDWMNVAPDTPGSAFRKACELWEHVLMLNSPYHLTEVLLREEVRDDPDNFGHYLAMQALGHGVAWSGDHDDHKLELPWFEYEGFSDYELTGYDKARAEESGECNMNSIGSVRGNLAIARDEIEGFARDVWPGSELVPVKLRTAYRESIEAHERNLSQRLAVLEERR